MEIENLLAKVSESVHAGRAFGPPTEQGDVTLVPVAIVVGGGGGGSGSGPGEDDPGGSGGGFGSISWPIGAYVIKNGDVRWVPAVDVTRLAIAGVGLARALVSLKRRRRRSLS
jgi:uncharacterized spore protein YtfJ